MFVMLRYIMWMKSHCFATDASKVMECLLCYVTLCGLNPIVLLLTLAK